MNIIPRRIFPGLIQTLGDQRAVVITGMRRVGKTTTLHWLLEQIPSSNKIYIDLERLDQRAVFQESNYDLVLSFLRNRGLNTEQPLTVAIDEIQYVPNLPSVVKYLVDTYAIKFLLSGSSSFYLKNYFSESLAGRKIVYELYPLTFGEFLDFRGVQYRCRLRMEDMRFDPFEFERLKGFYDDFILFGGLPDVVLEERPSVKREILNDIFSSYINLDVRSMTDFQKMGELQQLLRVLALRVGNKLDLSKLAVIVGISRPTVSAYLEFLEKTYIIHRLPAWAGADKAGALGKKLYFSDNGLASVWAQIGEGPLFENAVYNQLKHCGELAYLSVGNEYEVDFIMKSTSGESPAALEVKHHPVQGDLQKLQRVANRHGLSYQWLIGRYPTASFQEFIWGGLIF
jgi:uncharacterized protein